MVAQVDQRPVGPRGKGHCGRPVARVACPRVSELLDQDGGRYANVYRGSDHSAYRIHTSRKTYPCRARSTCYANTRRAPAFVAGACPATSDRQKWAPFRRTLALGRQ